MDKNINRLLTEDMSAEELRDYTEELAQSAEGTGLLVTSMNELLVEEAADAPRKVLLETFDEVARKKQGRGESLLDAGFDEALDLLYRHKPDGYDEWNRSTDLRTEAGPSGMRYQHYRHMQDTCIQTIFVDLQCATAPFTLQDCFSILPVDRCDNSSTQFCERVWPQGPDHCCELPDTPAKFTSAQMERRCWKTPRPCVRSMTYGFHEDTSCYGVRAQIQADMEQMIRYWRDKQSEVERVAALFGIPLCGEFAQECAASAVTTLWNYDGNYTQMYQNPGEGLWTNSYCGTSFNPNSLVSGECVPAQEFRKRLKRSWEHMCHWHTGDPVECEGSYQFLLVDQCMADHLLPMFGEYRQEKCVGGPCQEKELRTMPGDPEFSRDYKFSRWARKVLVAFFLEKSINCVDDNGNAITIPPAANIETAEYRADNTFLLSRGFDRTFGCFRIDEFSRTLNGTDYFHYFDRGYDWMERRFWGYVYAPLRPWLTSRYFAFNPVADITNP